MQQQKTSEPAPPNPQWGGRFTHAPADIMQRINLSLDVDRRLWREDIAASRAHAAMLGATGIITATDAAAIDAGLVAIAEEFATGTFPFDPSLEDIHMNIEARLVARIGDAGRRLHTARSRNDQVATDFRLWVRAACDRVTDALGALTLALAHRAADHAAAPMPGYTHMQTAQPVTFGHHLLAYAEMFDRDRSRFADARRRLNECPLGAAALAGTGFPIDRTMTAHALGFDRPMRNSIDAVADRDFALDYLAAAAICGTHLSRLAEEIILWCGPLGFITLSDAYTTGSSIMPQKRNPDAAELVRAKAARLAGHLTTLLGVLKALPLAYAKDLQEDKATTFDAADTLDLSLAAMHGMITDLTPDLVAMRTAAGADYATATDLADALVRTLNLPFRDAHHITGRLVAIAARQNLPLDQLPLETMQAEHPDITPAILTALTVDASLASRTSPGGTAPTRVSAAAAAWL